MRFLDGFFQGMLDTSISIGRGVGIGMEIIGYLYIIVFIMVIIKKIIEYYKRKRKKKA